MTLNEAESLAVYRAVYEGFQANYGTEFNIVRRDGQIEPESPSEPQPGDIIMDGVNEDLLGDGPGIDSYTDGETFARDMLDAHGLVDEEEADDEWADAAEEYEQGE